MRHRGVGPARRRYPLHLEAKNYRDLTSIEPLIEDFRARASSSNRSSAKPTSPRRKLAALRNAVISGGYSNEGIIVAGRPLPPPGQERGILLNKIEGDFFHAAGCAILRGRDFSPRDTPASPKVAIIT
jgi:hypothetical protein